MAVQRTAAQRPARHAQRSVAGRWHSTTSQLRAAFARVAHSSGALGPQQVVGAQSRSARHSGSTRGAGVGMGATVVDAESAASCAVR